MKSTRPSATSASGSFLQASLTQLSGRQLGQDSWEVSRDCRFQVLVEVQDRQGQRVTKGEPSRLQIDASLASTVGRLLGHSRRQTYAGRASFMLEIMPPEGRHELHFLAEGTPRLTATIKVQGEVYQLLHAFPLPPPSCIAALSFSAPASDVTAYTPMAPAPQVVAQDAFGQRVLAGSGPSRLDVDLRLGGRGGIFNRQSDAYSATPPLASKPLTDGLATFDDLSLPPLEGEQILIAILKTSDGMRLQARSFAPFSVFPAQALPDDRCEGE